jgi:hypothetical protein
VNIADAFKSRLPVNSRTDPWAWMSMRKKRAQPVPSLLDNKSYAPEKEALKMIKAGP